MDLSIFLTPPVLAGALILILFSAWIGYLAGKSGEAKRAEQSMAKAAEAARAVLDKQRREQELRLETAEKVHQAELEKLKKEHVSQVSQLNRAQQELVDSLKEGFSREMERIQGEHGTLIEKLNADNAAAVAELEKASEQQLAELDRSHAKRLEELEARRQKEIEQLKEEMDRSLENLKREQQELLHDLKEQHLKEIAKVEHERDTLQEALGEAQAAVTRMEMEMREARLKNIFSVSKSGEKLVKVVRSVQELASELDETSRAVTGGDYSFFEAIKDQRDRETVLSLTGTPPIAAEEEEANAPADTPDAEEAKADEDEGKAS